MLSFSLSENYIIQNCSFFSPISVDTNIVSSMAHWKVAGGIPTKILNRTLNKDILCLFFETVEIPERKIIIIAMNIK